MPISSHLKSVRQKVGHDLLTLPGVAVSIFDAEGRILLGKDAETGRWALPGGAIDPNEQPADAAVRECFEETGLLVQLDALIGFFGGPEFAVRYPNGDLAYYAVTAFRGSIVGGSLKPVDGEFSGTRYFSQSECDNLSMLPSSRAIAKQAFVASSEPYFQPATWTPPDGAEG
jgi:8-oxo-dGTP pyrophosphatase MutT (NUDIX family)